jgi:hypothetical protein
VCLKCSCRGSPTPQITWLKNGLSLPPSERWTLNKWSLIERPNVFLASWLDYYRTSY